MITLQVTDDQNFPHAVLEDRADALVLFAAGFHGRQDAYWIKQAGIPATCVDNDPDLLAAMAPLYPEDWEFVLADAYEFTDTDRQWDVITLDPFTNQFQRCADHLDQWVGLARHTIVLGHGWNTMIAIPAGWVATDLRKRSEYDGGVYWTVMEKL